jgi:SAM-dependent methyltransferase
MGISVLAELPLVRLSKSFGDRARRSNVTRPPIVTAEVLTDLTFMSLSEALLEKSVVYRLWQAPFAAQKFAPVLAHNEMERINRVLDVGCGPGTNSSQFMHTSYLGIDINPDYIESARKNYGRDFVVADARTYRASAETGFDFILVNSFLHHICDDDVVELLTHLRSLLSSEGSVHILEPVLPPGWPVARLVAHADRGKFVRPLQEWESIFSTIFCPLIVEPYPLKAAGITLWNMLYFKGSASRQYKV